MKRINTLITGCAVFATSLAFGQSPLYTQGAVVNPIPGVNPNVGIGVPIPTFKLDLVSAPGAPGVNFKADEIRFGSGNTVFASQYSGVFGQNNLIQNGSTNSFALGLNNKIDNSISNFAGGENNIVDLNCRGVVVLGGRNHITNNTTESGAMGEDNTISNGHGSIAIGGHNVNTGGYTYTIGRGLNNAMSSTIMAGFGTASLFINGSNQVGIGGQLAPGQALDVLGTIRSSNLIGGGNLVANAAGDIVLGPVVGDNLGNHMATMDLDMQCFNIINSGDINFCTGMQIDQTSVPGELIINGGAVGIGVSPSTVGTSPGGFPAQLAVAGSIWASGFWYASDKRFKQNITQLPNALDMLKNFNGYSYEYMKEQYPEYNFQEGETYGFLAQEIMTVAPGLVQQGENGYYSVNYLGVIPILTEAIKEQQTQIEEKDAQLATMKQELADVQTTLAELKAEVTSICENGCNQPSIGGGNSSNETTGSRLGNNAPNPFNGRTTISYFVPQNTTSAYITINDLNGKFISKFDISTFGVDSKIEIQSSSIGLTPGIYLYSLVVNNQIVDSKQMIVTN